MPTPDVILNGLTTLANDWRWLAIVWHVFLVTLIVMLAAGWRPPVRVAGYLLAAPITSVSLLAWWSGNAFNGAVFALLALTLVGVASRFPNTPMRIRTFLSVASGVVLIVFGGTYPHFLRTDSWTAYLYASPFGLLPCPTLSVVIGSTLLFRNPGSISWSAPLVAAGFLYGSMGVFRLGVVLDWGLILGSMVIAAAAWHESALETSSHRRRAVRLPSSGEGLVEGRRQGRERLFAGAHLHRTGRPGRQVWRIRR